MKSPQANSPGVHGEVTGYPQARLQGLYCKGTVHISGDTRYSGSGARKQQIPGILRALFCMAHDSDLYALTGERDTIRHLPRRVSASVLACQSIAESLAVDARSSQIGLQEMR